MKMILLGALLYITMMAGAVLLVRVFDDGKPSEPDSQTKELCRQYADRNHKGELAPERWQWFLDQGIDLNEDFDWYQSCIEHNTTPVAR